MLLIFSKHHRANKVYTRRMKPNSTILIVLLLSILFTACTAFGSFPANRDFQIQGAGIMQPLTGARPIGETSIPQPGIPSAAATGNLPDATPFPTATTVPTALPAVTKLRGEVTIDQAVCHYGPGAPYLYKYGVYKGSNLEILRRVQGSNYVEIQAIGGNNPCWVRADYMQIKGNWMQLPAVRFEDTRLPISPYYAPPGGVSARRDGDQVTVFWNPLVLRAGDDSEQIPYIVEAWVCQGGQMVFRPVGSRGTAVTVIDEPGCNEPSFGYFIAAEKHGYTWRVKIPWKPALNSFPGTASDK